ncbi:uncharacterized protein LOC144601639 [Rhinoraja longicauda]
MTPTKATGSPASGSQATGVKVVPSGSRQLSLAATSRRTSVMLRYKRPPILEMIVKALENTNDRKGTSVPAIKNYILSAYPTVSPILLKTNLKRALSVGLEKGVLIRPASSKATGATGRFKLAANKAVKSPKENSNPNVDSTKTDLKVKVKTTEADKRSDSKKPKKSADPSNKKGVESGKALGKGKSEDAKKLPKKPSDKLPKAEGKKVVNKKPAQPLGTVKTGKAVKKGGGPSETLPKKALKEPSSDPKKGPKSQGRKGESSKAQKPSPEEPQPVTSKAGSRRGF